MKLRTIQTVFFAIFCMTSVYTNAQSAKKLYKSGNGYSGIGNFEKAIELYTESINLKPDFTKALNARANAYLKLEKYEKAANDYETLSELEPKEEGYLIKSGTNYFKAKKYEAALPLLNSALSFEPENSDLNYMASFCYLEIDNASKALEKINRALMISKSAKYYHHRGQIHLKNGEHEKAKEDFNESIRLDGKNIDAYNRLAYAQYSLGEEDEAIKTLGQSISRKKNNKTAYILRSHIYQQKKNYDLAIKDLSSLISYYPKEEDALLKRGLVYYEAKQYKNAISDLDKVIGKNDKNKAALEKRAKSFEATKSNELAVKDYKALLALLESDNSNTKLINEIKDRLSGLEKEYDAPKIVVNGQDKTKSIEVPEDVDETSINIKIVDRSNILNVKIDGKEINFDKKKIKQGQELAVVIADKQQVAIEAVDIHNNKSVATYDLVRVETGFPKVVITEPTYSKGSTIFVNTLGDKMKLEGQVVGKYRVKSLLVNDFPAQFSSSENNPKFATEIELKGLDKITFDIVDEDGNHLVKKFKLDKSDAEILSKNPMGRTWVVFVENSDYKNFTSLSGPKKEVGLMVKALSKYQVDKVIHKRNMTKSQMDWFFRHQLKKEVIENRVNSILLWYAGHGKFQDRSGYWIPVDSKMDDLSTYYNLTHLKSALKPYTKVVTHSLVVTDACESGPGFYMSMRSLPGERDCNDAKSTRFKSSQVVTSSRDDLADGDSEFTKAFANSLLFNSKNCIPIERVVRKVSSQLVKTKNKRPKFGKIAGFADENGSFVFIKK